MIVRPHVRWVDGSALVLGGLGGHRIVDRGNAQVNGQAGHFAAGGSGNGDSDDDVLARGYLEACKAVREDLAREIKEAADRHPDDELLAGLADRFRGAVTVVAQARAALLGGAAPSLAGLLTERANHCFEGRSKLVG